MFSRAVKEKGGEAGGYFCFGVTKCGGREGNGDEKTQSARKLPPAFVCPPPSPPPPRFFVAQRNDFEERRVSLQACVLFFDRRVPYREGCGGGRARRRRKGGGARERGVCPHFFSLTPWSWVRAFAPAISLSLSPREPAGKGGDGGSRVGGVQNFVFLIIFVEGGASSRAKKRGRKDGGENVVQSPAMVPG